MSRPGVTAAEAQRLFEAGGGMGRGIDWKALSPEDRVRNLQFIGVPIPMSSLIGSKSSTKKKPSASKKKAKPKSKKKKN